MYKAKCEGHNEITSAGADYKKRGMEDKVGKSYKKKLFLQS